jgi:Cd2+/Zn2+-exporting ATPase/Cu+-exporting ATPase
VTRTIVEFIIVMGEWFGLFDQVTERVPWPIGVAIGLIGGYPIGHGGRQRVFHARG